MWERALDYIREHREVRDVLISGGDPLIMATVGIAGLEKQYPNAISGGQQQRVALCRALIAGTKVVLFDEPLSNVDAQVRERLREELLDMQRTFNFASLFVTHGRPTHPRPGLRSIMLSLAMR